MIHQTVLKQTAIASLAIKPEGVYVDGTVGLGGHSLAIACRLKAQGLLIGIDNDAASLGFAERRLHGAACSVRFVQANASLLESVLLEHQQEAVDGCLFDFGISSWQLDASQRGFSYQRDEPLDMRTDVTQELTAHEIVNTYDKRKIVNILTKYADERRWAHSIANNIIRSRPIQTTMQLAEIIQSSVPYRESGHPARKTFQALRIEVNNELQSIEMALKTMIKRLRKGGRLVVISFHSLEDRLAKHLFREAACGCKCPRGFPVCVCNHKPVLKIITPKPLRPSDVEIKNNARARSALLRVAERL